ncbi:MAG: hypothetical protein J1E00_07725, partial [Oscillospiraceae bacterium]|nr:hypothetical protein [Oscillospiraceae bacterium]
MKELFTYLCNFSLITSVAVLLAVLLRPLLKKGPSFVRCILWALVFLRLAVPVGIAELSAPFAISQESVSLPNGEGNLAEEVVDPVQKPVQTPSVQTPTVQPSVPGSGSAPQQATSQQVMQQVQQQVPQEKIDVLRILSAVWAVGVVAMLGYMLASNLLLRHRVRNAIVYDSRIRV